MVAILSRRSRSVGPARVDLAPDCACARRVGRVRVFGGRRGALCGVGASLALGCAADVGPAAASPDVPPSRITLDGARVTSGSIQGEAAHATISADGAGDATSVSVRTTDQPELTVDAARSDWDLASRVVRFEGDVVATRGSVSLTCETLTVHYADEQRVERAEAQGMVVVRRGARVARSAQAVLHVDSGEVVLTGAPSLSEGASQMAGERIVLFLDDDRVECERCRLVVAGDAVAPR